jgi:hypothetical protein
MAQERSPFFEKNFDDLNAVFQKKLGLVQHETFQLPKGEIAVFFPDYGSGLSLINVCVYAKGTEGWRLVLERSTNTSHVSVVYDPSNNVLIFKSKAGKLLMTVPADSLTMSFDRSEQ